MDGAEVTGEATARFLVYRDDTELLRQAADHDFLTKLATAGGGKFYRADELPKFLRELAERPSAAGRRSRRTTRTGGGTTGGFRPGAVAVRGTVWASSGGCGGTGGWCNTVVYVS